MTHKYHLILGLALLALPVSQSIYAEALKLDLRAFSKGNYLLAKGRYPQTAAHWHQLSVMLLSNPKKVSQQEMWQSAGLAASLAAIAADKAEDPIAYQYWSDSTRYLLTGGTNWSQVQQMLHQRLETANTQLSVAMQVTDVTSGIDENLDIELTALQLWQEKLNLFVFTAPKLGLNRYDSEFNTGTSQPSPAVNQHTTQSQQPKTGKKLSGYESNFSQSPSFIPATTVVETAEPKSQDKQEDNLINASDAGLSSAAQTQGTTPEPKLPAEDGAPNANPLGIGNINQTQEIKVESLQKRQIEPVPVTKEDKTNDTSTDSTIRSNEESQLH